MQAHNIVSSEDGENGANSNLQGERAASSTPQAIDAEPTGNGEAAVFGIEFLSNLAHQLRSPLSSLRVWVDLLGDPQALSNPETSARLVEGIERATTRLDRQISDMLEVGYLRAGTISPEAVPVDAVEQITQAVTENEHAARNRGVSIDLQFGEQPVIVMSTDDRLRQIIACLLSNAVRFSPVDATITVRAGSAPKVASDPGTTSILEPRLGPSEEAPFYISVSDGGPGIPAELHHDVFEPFHRAARKDAHGGGGSGLGLSIALGLVKLYRGGMWLRSGPGDGAEFEFAVPRAPALVEIK